MAVNIVAELQVRGPIGLQPVLDNMKREIDKVSNINLAVNSNFGNIQTSLANINQQFKTLAAAAASSNSALSTKTATVSKLSSSLVQASGSAQKVRHELSALATTTHTGTTSLEKFAAASGLAARRFIAFSASAILMVRLAGAIKEATVSALSFEREMVRLQQVSGDQKTELRAVQEEVTKLASTFGVSSAELVRSAVVIRQAGVSSRDTAKALEALAKASLAPNFDSMSQTVEGAIAIMRQFKVDADGLKGALGSVNAVAGEFAVEAGDLITAIQKTGGAFAAAAGDFVKPREQLNQLIALFTSVRATTRESADAIATGLRTIFSRLQREDTIEALRSLRIELRYTSQEAANLGNIALEDQFVGAAEAIQRISEGLAGLRTTDPRYSAIVEQIGGTRQISRVIPLLQQQAEAQRALNVARAGEVSLDINAQQAQQSLLVQTSRLKEEYLGLFRAIADSKGFQSLARFMLDMASGAGELLSVIRPLVPLLITIAGLKILTNLKGISNQFLGVFGGVEPQTAGRVPFPFVRRAGGGIIPGSGSGDTVPALLEPGEFVVKKSAAQKIGYENLFRMQKFADGGLVRINTRIPRISPLDSLTPPLPYNPRYLRQNPRHELLQPLQYLAKDPEAFIKKIGQDGIIELPPETKTRSIYGGLLKAGEFGTKVGHPVSIKAPNEDFIDVGSVIGAKDTPAGVVRQVQLYKGILDSIGEDSSKTFVPSFLSDAYESGFRFGTVSPFRTNSAQRAINLRDYLNTGGDIEGRLGRLQHGFPESVLSSPSARFYADLGLQDFRTGAFLGKSAPYLNLHVKQSELDSTRDTLSLMFPQLTGQILGRDTSVYSKGFGGLRLRNLLRTAHLPSNISQTLVSGGFDFEESGPNNVPINDLEATNEISLFGQKISKDNLYTKRISRFADGGPVQLRPGVRLMNPKGINRPLNLDRINRVHENTLPLLKMVQEDYIKSIQGGLGQKETLRIGSASIYTDFLEEHGDPQAKINRTLLAEIKLNLERYGKPLFNSYQEYNLGHILRKGYSDYYGRKITDFAELTVDDNIAQRFAGYSGLPLTLPLAGTEYKEIGQPFLIRPKSDFRLNIGGNQDRHIPYLGILSRYDKKGQGIIEGVPRLSHVDELEQIYYSGYLQNFDGTQTYGPRGLSSSDLSKIFYSLGDNRRLNDTESQLRQRFALGGKVPSLLTPGEFLFDKKSAQNIGYGNLAKMNSGGTVPDLFNKYAQGGIVAKNPQEEEILRMIREIAAKTGIDFEGQEHVRGIRLANKREKTGYIREGRLLSVRGDNLRPQVESALADTVNARLAGVKGFSEQNFALKNPLDEFRQDFSRLVAGEEVHPSFRQKIEQFAGTKRKTEGRKQVSERDLSPKQIDLVSRYLGGGENTELRLEKLNRAARRTETGASIAGNKQYDDELTSIINQSILRAAKKFDEDKQRKYLLNKANKQDLPADVKSLRLEKIKALDDVGIFDTLVKGQIRGDIRSYGRSQLGPRNIILTKSGELPEQKTLGPTASAVQAEGNEGVFSDQKDVGGIVSSNPLINMIKNEEQERQKSEFIKQAKANEIVRQRIEQNAEAELQKKREILASKKGQPLSRLEKLRATRVTNVRPPRIPLPLVPQGLSPGQLQTQLGVPSIPKPFQLTEDLIRQQIGDFSKSSGLDLNRLVSNINVFNDKNIPEGIKREIDRHQLKGAKGAFNTKTKTLSFNASHITSQEELRKTLAHELGHGIDYSLGNNKYASSQEGLLRTLALARVDELKRADEAKGVKYSAAKAKYKYSVPESAANVIRDRLLGTPNAEVDKVLEQYKNLSQPKLTDKGQSTTIPNVVPLRGAAPTPVAPTPVRTNVGGGGIRPPVPPIIPTPPGEPEFPGRGSGRIPLGMVNRNILPAYPGTTDSFMGFTGISGFSSPADSRGELVPTETGQAYNLNPLGRQLSIIPPITNLGLPNAIPTPPQLNTGAIINAGDGSVSQPAFAPLPQYIANPAFSGGVRRQGLYPLGYNPSAVLGGYGLSPQLIQSARISPVRGTGESGRFGTSLQQIIGTRASRGFSAEVAALGGASNVSQETLQKIKEAETLKATNEVRRQLLSAEKNYLNQTKAGATTLERNNIATERTNAALEWRLRVVTTRGLQGNLLGTTTTFNEGQAAGIAAPGAGGFRYALGSFKRDTIDGIRQSMAPIRKFGEAYGARFSQGAFSLSFIAPYIAQQVEKLGGEANTVPIGGEGGFKRAKAAGGLIQGASLGAVGGSIIGGLFGPAGAVVGTALGALAGAAYFAAQAWNDAAKEIQDVRIANTLTTVVDRLSTVARLGEATDATSILSATKELESYFKQNLARSQDEAKSTKRFLSGGEYFSPEVFEQSVRRNITQDLGQRLPQFAEIIGKRAQKLGNDNPNEDPKELLRRLGSSDDLIKNSLNAVATVRGLSVQDVLNEQLEIVKSGQKLSNRKPVNIASEQINNSNIQLFGRFEVAVESASDALSPLKRQSELLADVFSGVVNASKVDLGSDTLDKFGRFGSSNIDSLNTLRAYGGSQGQRIADIGQIANQIQTILPGILAVAASDRSVGEDKSQASIRKKLNEGLGITTLSSIGINFDGLSKAVDSVLDSLEKMGGDKGFGAVFDILEKVGAVKLSEDALANFTEPVKSASNALKILENEINANIGKLAQYRSLQATAGQSQDRVSAIGVLSARIQSDIRADNNFTRRGPGLSVDFLNSAIQARQERLTGFQGAKANDVVAISGELNRLKKEIIDAEKEQQNAAKSNKGALEASIKLTELKDRASNLAQALTNLTEVSERTAAAQERLAQIDRDKDSRIGFGERFLSSSIEERGRINRGLGLANQANVEGNLLNFLPEQQKLIIETLRSLGNSELTGFKGQPIAADLLEKLITNSGFGLSAERKKERLGLQTGITEDAKRAEEASKAIAEFQKVVAGEFLANIKALSQEFGKLAGFLKQGEIREKRDQLGNLGDQIGKLKGFQKQKDLLGSFGITTEEQVKALKAQRGQFEKFTGATESEKKLNEIRDSSLNIARRATFKNLGIDLRASSLNFQRSGEATVEGINSRVATETTNKVREYLNSNDIFNQIPENDKSEILSIFQERFKERFTSKNAGGEGEEFKQKFDDQALYAFNSSLISAIEDVLNAAVTRKSIDRIESGRELQKIQGFDVFKAADTVREQGIGGATKILQALDAFDGVKVKFTGLGEEIERLKGQFKALQEELNKITSKKTEVVTVANGGRIFSPRGTDTVPAMLTPGEMVINKQSTAANYNLLSMINKKKGPVYLADGGGIDIPKQLESAKRSYEKGYITKEQYNKFIAKLKGFNKSPYEIVYTPDIGPARSIPIPVLDNEGNIKGYELNGRFQRVRKDPGTSLGDELRFNSQSNPYGASSLLQGRSDAYDKTLKRIDKRIELYRNRFQNLFGTYNDTDQLQVYNSNEENSNRIRKLIEVRESAAEKASQIAAQNQRQSGNINLFRLRQLNANRTIGPGGEGQQSIFENSYGKLQDYFVGQAREDLFRDYLRSGRLQRFASGGMVGGTGGTDSQLARLTPGEFVLRPSAVSSIGVNNLERINKYAEGGLVGAAASSGLNPEVANAIQSFGSQLGNFSSQINIFSQSVGILSTGFSQFNESARILSEALKGFPSTLTVDVTQRGEIVLNGAETLSKLEPSIKTWVENSIKDQLNKVFKNTLPDAGFNLE